MTDPTAARAKPMILFVCRHNAGRSQIAAGLARARFGDTVEIRSAGIEPAEEINQVGAEALGERGIDITDQKPRKVTDDDLRQAARVVTLVAGVDLPAYPGVAHERWELPDPDAWDLEHIRVLVGDIDRRVQDLPVPD